MKPPPPCGWRPRPATCAHASPTCGGAVTVDERPCTPASGVGEQPRLQEPPLNSACPAPGMLPPGRVTLLSCFTLTCRQPAAASALLSYPRWCVATPPEDRAARPQHRRSYSYGDRLQARDSRSRYPHVADSQRPGGRPRSASTPQHQRAGEQLAGLLGLRDECRRPLGSGHSSSSTWDTPDAAIAAACQGGRRGSHNELTDRG